MAREIGRGTANRTEPVALNTNFEVIVAVEIDSVVNGKTLIKQIKKVRYESFGAEQIP